METKPKSQLSATREMFSSLEKSVLNIKSFQQNIEKSVSQDISYLVGSLLFGAIVLNASDIHLEPEDSRVKIRLRLDGSLYDAGFLQQETYHALLNRLKLFSGLKLNITSKPQDGRFSVSAAEDEIEVRSSTLPSEFGEAIVMRLLNPKNLISLKELGLRSDMAAILTKEIKKPNGMIISTGPTGSGKTTSLYAILKEINAPEVKIITIEDPIEYHLEGISQSQVDEKKGYDFASGLSTIVRQDPDVILVGEIRDKETASIAIQAAMTGHLVLTTLHTNDAAGSIARFQALGEQAKTIAPALNLVIAQRLVRKICPFCSEKKKLSQKQVEQINQELKALIEKNLIKKVSPETKISLPKGCEKCNQIGYKGRVGIYEFLLVDEEMESFVSKEPSIVEIKERALTKGMTTMRQDGLVKILQGITSFEEVDREAGES